MNNRGFKNWIQAIGTLRAGLLSIAIISKVFLYIFNPPFSTPTKPLILSFPFLVALDLIWAVVNGTIVVECVRLGFSSTSSWSPKTHFIVCSALIALLAAGYKVLAVSQISRQYYAHGWSLAEKGDYRQALLSLDISVKYDTKNVIAYLERAYLYRKLGQFAASLNDCSMAVDQAPNNADAYACRGYTYYYLCDRQKAVDEWKKAIALDPKLSGGLEKWITAVKDPLYKC